MIASTVENEFTCVQPAYDHTQYAPMYWLILVPAFAMAGAAYFSLRDAEFVYLQVMSGFLFAVGFSFRWLRVVDEGAHLALRYGPLPIFRRRIAFADIADARRSTSSFIDGWGIHWVPGRGWTFNLWGFDCVLVTLQDGRTMRIGTDDADGLSHFLQQRQSES